MPRRRRKPPALYHFFIVLPDHLYPFRSHIQGKWVRGIRSYNRAVAQAERRLGRGHFGVWINCYRSFFHVLGAVAIIALSAYVANELFGSKQAIYTMLAAATFLISLQEFYYHRRQYEQVFRKSVVDWLSWVVPIGIYIFLLV